MMRSFFMLNIFPIFYGATIVILLSKIKSFIYQFASHIVLHVLGKNRYAVGISTNTIIANIKKTSFTYPLQGNTACLACFTLLESGVFFCIILLFNSSPLPSPLLHRLFHAFCYSCGYYPHRIGRQSCSCFK